MTSPHQAACGQPRHDVGQRGAIDPHLLGKRRLLEAGLGRDRREDAVLHRRDVEGRAFLRKQGEMDLVQPSNQKAGACREGKRPLLAHEP